MPPSVARAYFAAMGGPLALGFTAGGQAVLGRISFQGHRARIKPIGRLIILGASIQE